MEKQSFIAIGFSVIPTYSTVAVVGLDYFIHRLVDGAFNPNNDLQQSIGKDSIVNSE